MKTLTFCHCPCRALIDKFDNRGRERRYIKSHQRKGIIQTIEWKNTIRECLTGKNNPKWKGDKVGYRGLHYWVIRNLGKAIRCEKCGKEKTSPKSIQWANRSGDYLRNLTDWLQLCVPCHRAYDRNLVHSN